MHKRNIAPPRAKAAQQPTPVFTFEQLDWLADAFNNLQDDTLRKIMEVISKLHKETR